MKMYMSLKIWVYSLQKEALSQNIFFIDLGKVQNELVQSAEKRKAI